ncbi:SlyX family protein [Pleionea litopenaei]|uniref:Protein SlyX homolog n=1 Tax=Pleionea litopenaei TaxID=3070815 RepID=A0AA51RUH1_9GAMM|nr:SlyX family protein [Pleionea sp. HL-JVS1]WMS87740.1 SlyX family protein [Pleionea sp. HL-JVS1]
MNIEQRVTDLECQLSFQDDTIETLNQTVIAQRKQIDELSHQISKLSTQLTTLQNEQNDDKTADERPPHY